MAHIKARSADGVCADESALAVAAVPMDKRQVYDWDTRIHLLARGPGIAKGASFELPATQVDVAPTFLGLAGVQPPPDMDGKSLLPHVRVPSFSKTSAQSLQSVPNHHFHFRIEIC